MKYDAKDLALASKGREKIEWADETMPVLRMIRKRFEKEKPLEGKRIAACLHVTSETANLMRALKAGGAELALCASNPLSTQDEVVASLVEDYGISTFAVRGADNKTYYGHINSALDIEPNITMDDGADLVSTVHKERRDLLKNVIGGSEETTTGVIRLKAMEQHGVLEHPMIAVPSAVGNAVARATGVEFFELPLDPERIYLTLKRAAEARAGEAAVSARAGGAPRATS